MKKYIHGIIFSFLLVFLSMGKVSAQQNTQYTQYMYNTVSFNSAYAGNRGVLSVLGAYRNQWIGLDGAPETLNFNINSPIGVKGVGLGLGFTNDRIGPSIESTVSAQFSYTIQLDRRETRLSFGLNAGVNALDIDVNKLTIYDPNDFYLNNRSVASPVVGMGFYLHNNNWYLGISTPNILETEHYNDVAVSTATEKMHLFLIGGYVFDVNPNLKFKPAFLVKEVQGAPLSVDVSANFLFNGVLTFGAAYRWDAAVSALAGFQISDQLMIGYAYDFETTELSRYNSGSHEIFLRFELGVRMFNKVNPRFF